MNKQMLRWVIFGGLFIVPFVPFLVSSSLFFPYITTKAFTWRIVVEFIFASWIILALLDPLYRPKKSPILYALAAFLLIIGLADIFGTSPLKSFWSNSERMEGYITLLHLGAYFLVASSVFKEMDWRKWWNTSLAASFLMVLLASREALALNEWRVDGTFGNPSYLAVYLLIHIFVAALFLWRERSNRTLRWLYSLLILSQLIILYNTATRGAIIGLIGGLLVAALLNLNNKENRTTRKIAYVGVIGAVVLVGGFWLIRNSSFVQNSPVLVRFSEISTEELKSGGRSFVWPIALQGIKDRPILGWGQENFVYIFSAYYDPQMYRLEPWFDRAHNIFLDWAVAGGLLGLLAYLSLYAVLVLVTLKDRNLSKEEKSIIVGLVVAYFIHNFFVFDHLISYILFFSLLAYLQSRSEGEIISKKQFSEDNVTYGVLPLTAILLALVIYFSAVKPIVASASLISMFNNLQVSGQEKEAALNIEKAYRSSGLGRLEVAEQISASGVRILSSGITIEEKNAFFKFAREALIKEAEENPREARIQIATGSFLVSTGYAEEGNKYLNRALELSPKKQSIYFEIGNSYIVEKKYTEALEILRQAYELAPEYTEAKVIYLIGAIYAGDRETEARLVGEIEEKKYVFEDRIINTYYTSGRIDQVRKILERRKELDPANASKYNQYLNQLR